MSLKPEAGTRVTNQPEPVGGKRKRADDEGDVTVKVAKKQRSSSSPTGEHVSTADSEPAKKGGRTRRSRSKPSVKAEDDHVIVVDDSPAREDAGKGDIMWLNILCKH